MIQAGKPLSDAEREDASLKQYKRKGLVAADQDAIEKMDNQLEKGRSPILPVGVKAEGGLDSDSQVADTEQWDGVRKLVRRKVKQSGNEIVQGRVDIKPYRKGKHSPCTYCSYRPVCQFDTLMEDNEYRFLSNMDKDVLWNLILKQKEEA